MPHRPRVLAFIAAFALAVPSPTVLAAARDGDPPADDTGRNRQRVGVLPVEYGGPIEDHWRATISERLHGGLKGGGFDSVDVEVGGKPCDDAQCWNRVAHEIAARHLVRTRVDVKERDYAIELHVIEAETGRVIASARDGCELCGAGEVAEMVATQAAILRTRLEDLVVAAPRVAFESTPAGALVFIDGELVGMTPVERTVTPGRRSVRITKDGYVAEERQIEAVRGVSETVSVGLAPAPREWRRSARPWGWVLLTAGIGGTVTGAVLLGLDEREYKGKCTGADQDALGNCRFLYDTLTGGITSTAVGVAALAAGIALLVVTRSRKRGARDVAWHPGFRPGGIGVLTEF